MADLLRSYLGAAGRRPFAWGGFDCFLFAADWIARSSGIDPAAGYRGRYACARSARALLKAGRGPVAFADRVLTAAGWRATDDPKPGDVALVRAALFRRGEKLIVVPVAAVCVRPRLWAIKSAAASLTLGAFPVIKAWTPGSLSPTGRGLG